MDYMRGRWLSNMKDIVKWKYFYRKTIEDNLSGVYHDRINYPKLKIGHQATFESNENSGENKSDSPKNN